MMEIIMIMIGVPIALGVFSILRTKVDPDYKKRVDAAIKTRKVLRDQGVNDPMIDDEIRVRDYKLKAELKKEKKIKKIIKNINEDEFLDEKSEDNASNLDNESSNKGSFHYKIENLEAEKALTTSEDTKQLINDYDPLKNSNSLIVRLTPAKYLSDEGRRTREKLFDSIDIDTVLCENELTILHHSNNEYDDKALKVLWKGEEIGFVQKKFKEHELDFTDVVNNFCFSSYDFFRNVTLIFNEDGNLILSNEDSYVNSDWAIDLNRWKQENVKGMDVDCFSGVMVDHDDLKYGYKNLLFAKAIDFDYAIMDEIPLTLGKLENLEELSFNECVVLSLPNELTNGNSYDLKYEDDGIHVVLTKEERSTFTSSYQWKGWSNGGIPDPKLLLSLLLEHIDSGKMTIEEASLTNENLKNIKDFLEIATEGMSYLDVVLYLLFKDKSNFRNLKKLNLDFRTSYTEPLGTIPASIANLTNLESLYIRNHSNDNFTEIAKLEKLIDFQCDKDEKETDNTISF